MQIILVIEILLSYSDNNLYSIVDIISISN